MGSFHEWDGVSLLQNENRYINEWLYIFKVFNTIYSSTQKYFDFCIAHIFTQ